MKTKNSIKRKSNKKKEEEEISTEKKRRGRKTNLEIAGKAPGQRKITQYFKATSSVEINPFFNPQLMQKIFSQRRFMRNDDVTDARTYTERVLFALKCEKMRRRGIFSKYHGTKAFRKILEIKRQNSKMFTQILNILPDCHSIEYLKYFQ